MAETAVRSWDDQKLIDALNEQIAEYKAGLRNLDRLFREAIDLLGDARPYVEHEVEHAGAKPDRDLLEVIDILLKAAAHADGQERERK